MSLGGPVLHFSCWWPEVPPEAIEQFVGAQVDPAEMEELERAHDAGDLRAEDRLRLLREGRRSR